MNVCGYSNDEKFHIAREYLIPKLVKENFVTGDEITFSDDAVRHIILDYTREQGVRNLERELDKIYRKAIVLKLILPTVKRKSRSASILQIWLPISDRSRILSIKSPRIVSDWLTDLPILKPAVIFFRSRHAAIEERGNLSLPENSVM